jgi:hypothetical protein
VDHYVSVREDFAGAHVNHGHMSDYEFSGWRLSESRNRRHHQQEETKQTDESHRISPEQFEVRRSISKCSTGSSYFVAPEGSVESNSLLCLDDGLLLPNPVKKELPTIRELGGSLSLAVSSLIALPA